VPRVPRTIISQQGAGIDLSYPLAVLDYLLPEVRGAKFPRTTRDRGQWHQHERPSPCYYETSLNSLDLCWIDVVLQDIDYHQNHFQKRGYGVISRNSVPMGHGLTPKDLSLDYHSLGAILLRPQARGSVELAGSDPFEKPVIRSNYLSSQHDREMLIHGVRVCQEIVSTEAYQKEAFVRWEMPENAVADISDEEVLQYIRDTSETIYHPMCTARMGKNEVNSVVDQRLRVHGVTALRVVDASVFPTPLACHPVSSLAYLVHILSRTIMLILSML
jgi:hypothetical protein